MNLSGDELRGHTDSIILSILEKENSYGYRINKEIEAISDGAFILTEATLYTVLKRLEKQGYIISYWEEGLNNIKRKYYSITETGIDYLNQARKNWENTYIVIDKFLGGKNGN